MIMHPIKMNVIQSNGVYGSVNVLHRIERDDKGRIFIDIMTTHL